MSRSRDQLRSYSLQGISRFGQTDAPSRRRMAGSRNPEPNMHNFSFLAAAVQTATDFLEGRANFRRDRSFRAGVRFGFQAGLQARFEEIFSSKRGFRK